MLNKIAFKIALAGLMASLSGTVAAQEEFHQWSLGIGGGISQLQPDTTDTAIGVDEKNGTVATVFIGWNLDNRSSGQLQLSSLGEIEYSDGQSTASYIAGDASVLYQFYDSRNHLPQGAIFGTTIYGRIGLGTLQWDTNLSLVSDSRVYFGVGAGMETYLSANLAMRLEALFHDTDAGSATLTLVRRFGGHRRLPAAYPPILQKPTTPPPPIKTETLETVDTTDTSVSRITVLQSAVAVPTDLPETYEIAPTGVAAVDAPLNMTADDVAIPGSNSAAVVPQSPVFAAIAENHRLSDSAMSGTVDAGKLTQVELPAGLDVADIPEVETVGSTTETLPDPISASRPQTDSDTDGVMDDQDQCPESAPGYPVTGRGCPAFGGMLPDLIFNDRTADLSNSSYAVLDKLVQQLTDFPNVYIELVAHTDNTGTEAEQSELTRQRLRSIGVYLVRHGINQDRLLLRSYGGLRPAFDNLTAEGRRRNNRIEVFENP